MPQRIRKRAAQRVASGEAAAELVRVVAVALIAAKIALVLLVVDPWAADAFALPKASVSRALAYVIGALLIAYVLATRDTRRVTPLLIAIGAYLAVAAAATALAVHPLTSLFGAPRRFLGLSQIVDGATLAVAVGILVRTRRDVRWVASGLGAALAVTLVYSTIQALGLEWVRWTSGDVVTGMIGNTGVVAGLLATAVGMAVVAVVAVPLDLRYRIVLAAFGAWCAVLVFATGTRAPAIATIGGIVAGALFGLRAQGRRGLGRAQAAIVAGAVVLTLVVLPFTPAAERLARLVSGGDSSVSERAVIYAAALQAIADRPVLGAGPDGFISVFLTSRAEDSARVPGSSPQQSSTHSWPLHHAVGTGVLGLAAIGAVSLVALYTLWRRAAGPEGWAYAAAGAGLVAFLLQGIFNIAHIATETVFWAYVGLAAATLGAPSEGSSPPVRLRCSQLVGPFGVAGVVAAIAVWTAASGLSVSHALAESGQARRAGNAVRAEASARRAVSLDDRRADHWNTLGIAQAMRSPAQAIASFRKAADLAPYEPVYPMNVAKEALRLMLTSPNDEWRRLALDHSKRAVEADPFGPEAHSVRARVLLSAGSPKEALAEADRAIALAPRAELTIQRAYAIAAEAYLALGDRDKAVEQLRAAIDLALRVPENLELTLRTDLAQVLVDAGRYDEARREAEYVLARQSENIAAKEVLARLPRR